MFEVRNFVVEIRRIAVLKQISHVFSTPINEGKVRLAHGILFVRKVYNYNSGVIAHSFIPALMRG